MNTAQILQKFYFIPVIVIWLIILLKNRPILGIKFKSLKWEQRPGKEVYLPIVAIMAVMITLSLVVPLAYDEAFTFTQFTYPGFQPSLFNYPAPNNHVFHSLLTCISWRLLQFTQSEFSVRLPALCFTAFTLYFVFTRYLEGKTYAIVLVAILFIFSPNIVEFAFQARGYSMMTFCAIASYFFAIENNTTRHLTFHQRLNIILLLSAVGLFTNPSYLYAAGVVYLIFVTLNFREIKKGFIPFAIINIFYGLTVLLLYTPIIASKGLQTITSNENVIPVDGFSGKLLTHLNFLVNFVTLPFPLSWLIIILFIWNTIRQKLLVNVYVLVVPVILMCILKQLPFGRVFLPIGGIILVNACMAITGSAAFSKITSASLSLKQQVPAFLLIAVSCVLGYIYFNNYHIKGDLAKAYYFKKIEPHIKRYDRVYTKSIESDWDMYEILSATLKLKGIDHTTEIEKDIKEYNLDSAIIISTVPMADFKVVESISDFEGKPFVVLEPAKQ